MKFRMVVYNVKGDKRFILWKCIGWTSNAEKTAILHLVFSFCRPLIGGQCTGYIWAFKLKSKTY